MKVIELASEKRRGHTKTERAIKSPFEIRNFLDSDTDLLEDYFNRQSVEARRLRTFSSTQRIPRSFLTVYQRRNISALVLVGLGQIWGESIIAVSNEAHSAEIALSIDEQLFRLGFSDLLLKATLHHASECGFGSVYADTQAINQRFIRFCRRQHFIASSHPDDARQIRLTLKLEQSPRIPPEFPIQASCLG